MLTTLKKYAAVAATTASSFAVSAQLSMVHAQDYLGTVEQPEKGYANDIGEIITGVLSFVMIIAALLLLMYMIWGGIEWVTSGGDKGKTESARNKITNAVIGMIILAAAFAVTNMVVYFLGFDDLENALELDSDARIGGGGGGSQNAPGDNG